MDSILKDTVPPHNNDAEMATLGAMLLNWGSVSQIATLLRAEHFYNQQNQVIFHAMMRLFSKGETCDTLALVEELSKNGELEKSGGAV